tara:strand:- start:197 stop:349 length:153 start_codon:yes stop_codon:yes gene_type:complete
MTRQWLRNPKWRDDVRIKNDERDEGQQQQKESSEKKDGEEIRNQKKSEQG